MNRYLFWDIDGTLLLTNRAGVFALEDAAEEVTGTKPNLSDMRTAGMTDAEIACAVVGEELVGAFLTAYERLLPERLAWREGRVLTNVRENLEALSARDDVINMLLTGNVAGGAEAKLRHYGLWQYFGAGGAYSVEGSDRPGIARRARELAAEHGGEVPPGERMIVIGDTPHDVHCGQAIGARTIAVASGPGYGVDDLRATDAWVVLEHLPEPGEFFKLLEAP